MDQLRYVTDQLRYGKKDIFHKRNLVKYNGKKNEIHKIKYVGMLKRFMFACGYIKHRLNPLLRTNQAFSSPVPRFY